MRKTNPFVAATTLRRTDAEQESAAFASRHFAVRRAGFLLREYARQQESTPTADVEMAVIAPAQPAEPVAIQPAAPAVVGPSEDEIAARVAEAEERGRQQALAEVLGGLDAVISALDSAASELELQRRQLESSLVVPLAQASIDLGAQIARQRLATAEGLDAYIAEIEAALGETRPDDAVSTTLQVVPLAARLNPEDVELLERATVKPRSIRWQADPLVSRGGVILGRGDKVIDDRFENRLREVREAALAAAAKLMHESQS